MYNLNWQGKPLEDLDYEETVEYEKELNKKIVAADRAGMSEGIIKQLQTYLEHVKLYQKEALDRMKMGLDGKSETDEDDDTYLFIIGEPEPDNEDEQE